MCQAFHASHSVSLFARRTEYYPGHQNIFSYYGISEKFELLLPQNKSCGSISSLYSYWFLLHLLKRRKFDICFGRHLKYLAIAGFFGMPIIYEAHEMPKKIKEMFWLKRVLSSDSFKGLVCISGVLREKYLRLFPGLSENKVLVAHDGINLEFYDSIASLKDQLPGQNTYNVGYVGGLKPEKGIQLIIETAGILKNADFHLVGGSPAEIDYWEQQCPNMFNIFFHGPVTPEKAVQYQKSFDVLLAPYQKKSWTSRDGKLMVEDSPERVIGNSPLKFFEYMSAEKPILASDIPVAREVFTQGVDALLSDNSPEQWAEWIQVLMQDRNFAASLAQNARQKVHGFTWKKRSQKILSRFMS
ncbi:glycosyltransferase [Desulfonatronospira thiodismutans]